MSFQKKMTAAVLEEYGIEGVKIVDVKTPECGETDVLVETRAASMNPYDWHQMTGTPLLMRLEHSQKDKTKVLGTDFSGVIIAVGKGVKDLSIGDRVFGFAEGSFSQYVCTDQSKVAKVSSHIHFEEAASTPIAALTALQGLRDHGSLQKGMDILVNGASGGVGSFAIQIAKKYGVHVTAVCSEKNRDLVLGLGADEVLDYNKVDFTKEASRYDLIFDLVGNKTPLKVMKVLRAKGTYVTITGEKNKVLGPVWHWLKTLLLFRFTSKKAKVFITQQDKHDLDWISKCLEEKTLKPVIQKVYSLEDIKKAFVAIESGHTRGKIILTV